MAVGQGATVLLEQDVIRGLVDRRAALDAVTSALRDMADGSVAVPPELAMRWNGGELHIKGAAIGDSPWLAFKVATGFPGNAMLGLPVNDGFTVVLEATTGRLARVLLDRGWLTDLRTGAAGALAADLLARADATRVALIGAGGQSRFQVEALNDVRQLEAVRVWNRTPGRAESLAVHVATHLGLAVEVSGTVEEAVSDADIVVTTTSSRTALLRGEWLRPGTHVTAVGADFPDKQELHVGVFARADVVIADDLEVCGRVGDLHHALSAGAVSAADVGSLSDLLVGRASGRTTDTQITIADQCGLGLYDAAMAHLVMSRAEEGE